MKTSNAILVFALGLVPTVAVAQKWEVGGAGGGSFYTSRDVKRANATAEATLAPGYGVSAFIGQEMGRYWGGDIRYTFMSNEMQLKSNSLKATFGSNSHSIHYDFLLHFSPVGSKTRPYFAFGAGVRQYRGTGLESVTQPLSEFALLTKTTEMVPLASLGVGVKIRLGERAQIRIEVKDYITPVPEKLFAPNRDSEFGGWFHNFAPMVGISYVF